MTIWPPELRNARGPKYRAIADAIIEAIGAGALPAGGKLPPQRNLAYDLGVTLGTVTRAYQEVEREGLTKGEVGRGTFVLDEQNRKPKQDRRERLWPQTAPRAFDPEHTPVDMLYSDPRILKGGYELSANYPLLKGAPEMIAESMRRVARPEVMAGCLQYRVDGGLPHHRQAANQWISRFGPSVDPNSILITAGAQSATQTSLISLTRPGDTILAEQLTWPGLKATASPLGLILKGVAMDEFGMRPDEFEKACRVYSPKLAYLLPTLHNPTSGVTPLERRRALVEIAERHDVYLLEDDIYGYLLDDHEAPLYALSPRLGIYITGLSKAVAPGLRIGYAAVPDGLTSRFIGAMRTSVLMASPIAAAMAADLVTTGAADECIKRQQAEIKARQKIVGLRLGNLRIRRHPCSSHCWLPIPKGFEGEQAFRARLLEQGVNVSPGSVFAIDDAMPLTQPHVRLCIGAEQERDRLDHALGVVAEAARRDEGAQPPMV